MYGTSTLPCIDTFVKEIRVSDTFYLGCCEYRTCTLTPDNRIDARLAIEIVGETGASCNKINSFKYCASVDCPFGTFMVQT